MNQFSAWIVYNSAKIYISAMEHVVYVRRRLSMFATDDIGKDS